MKVSINTEKMKKKNVDSIGTELGEILSNDCIIVSVTKKKNRDVYLEVAPNPFSKAKRKTVQLSPTDACVKFISRRLRIDEVTNQNVIKAITIGVSDAANARKIKGEIFYMTEVRRIMDKLQRTMLDYNIDTDHFFGLK